MQKKTAKPLKKAKTQVATKAKAKKPNRTATKVAPQKPERQRTAKTVTAKSKPQAQTVNHRKSADDRRVEKICFRAMKKEKALVSARYAKSGFPTFTSWAIHELTGGQA